MSNRGPRIQIVSRYLPIENAHGSATHILDFLRYLHRSGSRVGYVLLDPSYLGENPWHVIPREVRAVAKVAAHGHWRVAHILFKKSLRYWILPLVAAYDLLPGVLKATYRSVKKRLRRVCKDVAATAPSRAKAYDSLATPAEMAFARVQFSKFKPDVVIADYDWLGSVLDVLPLSVLKVIFVHDIRLKVIESLNKAGIHTGYSDWDWEKEATQLRKAQVLLTLNEDDAETLGEMAPECEIIRIAMSAVYQPHDAAERARGRCLYVGSGALENVKALQWFLQKVWSAALHLVPYCSLHVCGNVSDGIQEAFPNVRFLGRVDDLSPEYGAAEVCLIPHFVSGGVKIKLVEALSHGRACVSTSCGVDGLPEVAGKAVIVADTAEDFAAAVCTILTDCDKRRQMEEQARRFVVERLSPEAVYQPFVDRVYEHVRGMEINVRGDAP